MSLHSLRPARPVSSDWEDWKQQEIRGRILFRIMNDVMSNMSRNMRLTTTLTWVIKVQEIADTVNINFLKKKQNIAR